MTHPHDRAAAMDIETRRRKVASALLAGVGSFTALAEQLGVSNATITRDVKALEAQWRTEALATENAHNQGRAT